MRRDEYVHNELRTLLKENQAWGWGLLLLGGVVFVWLLIKYAPNFDGLAATSLLLCVAAIGAGVGKLGDAQDMKRIINVIDATKYRR